MIPGFIANPHFDTDFEAWVPDEGLTTVWLAGDVNGSPSSGSVRGTDSSNFYQVKSIKQCVAIPTTSTLLTLDGFVYVPSILTLGSGAALAVIWYTGPNCTNFLTRHDAFVPTATGTFTYRNITVHPPAGTQSANVLLEVVRVGSTGSQVGQFDSIAFDYNYPASISSVEPNNALAGATVTITGANIGSATNVTFNSYPVTFTIANRTTIRAIVPQSTTGSGPVRVSTPGNTATGPIFTWGCVFGRSPASASFAEDGGSGTINVTATSGCSWTTTTTAPWITLASGGGSGNGNVGYTVSANSSCDARTGSITVAGQSFTVNQAGLGSACAPASGAQFHGDFNGDGNDDILIRYSDATLAVWLMSGATIDFDAVIGSAGIYEVVGIGDFDGDNRSDILLREPTGQLGMWKMNGASVSSGHYVGSTGTSTVAGVGDFNGDGARRRSPAGFGGRRGNVADERTPHRFRPLRSVKLEVTQSPQ